ncbi:MAG: ChbG/HpnK family deacetylase [Lachnospiraceae bacterium]|nr:ChbG/HpnK family deacetylase [Lachnospiraceae bacterium]
MHRLIINADDFGISREVNAAVCECFSNYMITSATLMVNMPFCDEAVALSKERGFEERVGIHLNLTSGEPLTDGIRCYRCFCGPDGLFNAAFQKNTATRLKLTREESSVMAAEIEAQLVKYMQYGLPDHHLDSHHHVHTDPSVIKVLMPLMKKYGIRSVRLSRNMYRKMSFLKAWYKKRYNRSLARSGVFTTDYFGSFKDFSAVYEDLEENSLTEIMVHPMYDRYGKLVDTKTDMYYEKDFFNRLNAVYEFY